MPKLMTNLQMKEISGVDRAANLAEGWLMMKSASPEAQALISEAFSLTKTADPIVDPGRTPNMPLDLKALAKDHPSALAHIEALEKALAAGRPVAAPTAEPTEADILAKSLENLPAPVRKALIDNQRIAAEATEKLRKSEEKAELDELTAIAKSFDALPGVTTAFADTMFKAVHGDPKAVREMFKTLTVANKAINSGELFKERGSNAPAADSAEGQINALAKSYVETDHTLTMADAIAKAASSNSALYAEYSAEMNSKNRGN